MDNKKKGLIILSILGAFIVYHNLKGLWETNAGMYYKREYHSLYRAGQILRKSDITEVLIFTGINYSTPPLFFDGMKKAGINIIGRMSNNSENHISFEKLIQKAMDKSCKNIYIMSSVNMQNAEEDFNEFLNNGGKLFFKNYDFLIKDQIKMDQYVTQHVKKSNLFFMNSKQTYNTKVKGMSAEDYIDNVFDFYTKDTMPLLTKYIKYRRKQISPLKPPSQ